MIKKEFMPGVYVKNGTKEEYIATIVGKHLKTGEVLVAYCIRPWFHGSGERIFYDIENIDDFFSKYTVTEKNFGGIPVRYEVEE